jgi:hypothetical protein
MGRDMMNDSAEAVIINGIQDNDRLSAQYWLSHNSPRYANPEKLRYLAVQNKSLIDLFKKEPADDSTTAFESLFDMYYTMEKIHGDTEAKRQISKFVRMLAHDDDDLEQIFYASYTEWKNNKNDIEKKKQELKEQLDRNKEDDDN